MLLNSETVLLTGGAGSIGSEVVKRLLLTTNVRTIRVFDTNEYGLFKLKRKVQDDRLRTLLGDVRDRERIKMAIEGVDHVIHTASIKNIEVSEYNCPETVRVNCEGTINLIECCSRAKVKRFLNISSDKSVEYSTLYGATKFIQEKVVLWAAKMFSPPSSFANVRLGNIMDTRGNVFDVWMMQKKDGKPLTITDPNMKRHFMKLQDCAKFIINTLMVMENGATYVPKMQEYSIGEMAELVGENTKVIGLRPGEKIREKLIAPQELARDCEGFWLIKDA